ncbi:A24 family peptidase [Nocardia sp. NPDC127526]|uniref:A24 family peptidase n=1 Tax=Nocardia sp. NPDC127526 TaxID=3345393 RepID=UPI00363C0707
MEPLPLLILTAWCAALSWFDLRSRRLPNALTLPGAAAALTYATALGRPTLAVLGALLLATPYLLVHLWNPAALGAGDMKLALGLGAATALGGPNCWVWAALTAPMLTAAAGAGAALTATVAGPMPSPYETVTSCAHQRHSPIRSAALTAPTSFPDHAAPALPLSTGTIPHGPAMCAASILALLAAQ